MSKDREQTAEDVRAALEHLVIHRFTTQRSGNSLQILIEGVFDQRWTCVIFSDVVSFSFPDGFFFNMFDGETACVDAHGDGTFHIGADEGQFECVCRRLSVTKG